MRKGVGGIEAGEKDRWKRLSWRRGRNMQSKEHIEAIRWRPDGKQGSGGGSWSGRIEEAKHDGTAETTGVSRP